MYEPHEATLAGPKSVIAQNARRILHRIADESGKCPLSNLRPEDRPMWDSQVSLATLEGPCDEVTAWTNQLAPVPPTVDNRHPGDEDEDFDDEIEDDDDDIDDDIDDEDDDDDIDDDYDDEEDLDEDLDEEIDDIDVEDDDDLDDDDDIDDLDDDDEDLDDEEL